MSEKLKPARAVKPGDILKEELEARGWTQKEFAEIIERPAQVISEIINGKKSITAQTAILFAAALDTSPELWLNLESSYRLQIAQRNINITNIVSKAEQLAITSEQRLAKRKKTKAIHDLAQAS